MAAKIIPFRTRKKLSCNPDDLPADVLLDSNEAVEHSVRVMREDYELGRSIDEIAADWSVEASIVQEAIQCQGVSC